jgi:pyruvate kinase
VSRPRLFKHMYCIPRNMQSPFFNELKGLTPKPLPTTETVAVAAVNASLEEGSKVIIVLSTSGLNSHKLIR